MSTTKFNIHKKMTKCHICSTKSWVINVNETKHENLNGCNIVQCKKCHSVWYFCSLHNYTFSMSNQSKMVKHFTLLHIQLYVKENNSVCPNKKTSGVNNLDLDNDSNNEIFLHRLTIHITHQFHHHHHLQMCITKSPLIIILK